jgi:RNA polymerase sigma-70 factor (ECF subfamily)
MMRRGEQPISRTSAATRGGRLSAEDFDALYENHFEVVWSTLRRLGVPESSLEDAAQDVFVIVHRRLREFEARSSVRTWIVGIAIRVASDVRRAAARRGGPHDALSDGLVDDREGPFDAVQKAEEGQLLLRLLDRRDDEKRMVFVLAEIEGMSIAEIAEASGLNANTLSSRLRAAREAFEQAVARLRRIHR